VASSDPRRERLLLAAGLGAVFAASALTDLGVLGLAWAAAALLLRRGLLRALGRVLRAVVPVTLALAAVSYGWLRLTGPAPALAPFAALILRTSLVAFVTFSVLARVNLLRALMPWPTAARLVVLTLAQVHALRLVATESAEGLRSRLPRRPGALDVLRNAGGITAALLTLSIRNAREVSEAMRARGF
jgi:cobalt/nickel transport system permease protein